MCKAIRKSTKSYSICHLCIFLYLNFIHYLSLGVFRTYKLNILPLEFVLVPDISSGIVLYFINYLKNSCQKQYWKKFYLCHVLMTQNGYNCCRNLQFHCRFSSLPLNSIKCMERENIEKNILESQEIAFYGFLRFQADINHLTLHFPQESKICFRQFTFNLLLRVPAYNLKYFPI